MKKIHPPDFAICLPVKSKSLPLRGLLLGAALMAGVGCGPGEELPAQEETGSSGQALATTVLLYEHGNYGGRVQSLQPGRYDMSQLTGVGNDSVSSLQVPSGWSVTLYEHGFDGRSKLFTADTVWVGDDFNDLTSSVVVEAPSMPQSNSVYGHWSGSGGMNPASTANRQFIVDYTGPASTVTFNLTAPLDTYLYLTDVNGNVLAQDDDSGGNLTSRLSYFLSPGTYKLVAATYSPGASGEFTLKADKAVIRYPQRLFVQAATSFNWIYDDHGTGADNDVAVWRANLAQYPGYYSLGDVAQPFHGSAPRVSWVASGEGDVLARPADYAWVWSDWGSGGTHDVSIWEPLPAAGYTCLGTVTVLGYDKPSTDLIRCVRSEYVLPANPSGLWNDSGSGADYDVGIWQVEPRDHRGLALSTFIARPSHSDTGGNRYWVINKSATANVEFKGTPVDAVTAALFAPLIWLHGEEYYFPSSIGFFLPNVHESNGYMVTNQALGCDSCTDPQFLDGQRPNTTSVPIYAEIINRTQGGQPTNITDIVYWTFYPYNNGKRVCIGWYSPWGCVGGYSTFGNHVGDWEHLTVRFVEGRPSQVFLSQHSGGQTFNFGDKNNLALAGFHAEVYAAQGSHGIYPDAARHIYKTIGNGDFLADDTSRGIPWYTWNSTVSFVRQSPGTYGGSQSWLNSTSRWGNPKSGCNFSEQVSGECVLNDGPTGIMDKSASNPENLTLD
ncbi:Vps62-related protein [Archangium lansingense]|uniref:Vps62-related protein n=1 Tax=Archangium lansingense TaxID=2995310 RepID=A0ABT4ALE2_9BACT|nr:Vps62-related protein [Archangium lansinium]MCY1082512.1 Vps62-related protein [Archangium lansinium]